MNDTLSWKVRIAVLWAIGPVLEAAHLVLFTRVEDWGKYLGAVPLHVTFMYIIPLVMCLLSLTLKDKLNKWVNIVLGLFFAVLAAPLAFLEMGLGVIMYEGPSLGTEHALLLGLKVVVTLFIPWFAWRWPKRAS
ncbi:hypothetical protein ACFLVI_03325 [Chloroflexota bacterium]